MSRNRKENIDPAKKLPPLGQKAGVSRTRLGGFRSPEGSPKGFGDSFVSMGILTSKSPSYREHGFKSTETLMESTVIQKNLFCSGCSFGQKECILF